MTSTGQLEAVMERGRGIRKVPNAVRARLLSRARAIAAMSEAAPEPRLALVGRSRRHGSRVVLLAVAAALILVAAGAMAAFHAGTERVGQRVRRIVAKAISKPMRPSNSPSTREIPETEPETVPEPEMVPVPVPVRRPAPAARPTSRAKMPRLGRRVPDQDSYAAEIDLLQHAQSRYASREFPDVLVLVAEHARQFPDGRLAEEREALRIRSLAGAGRADEARRAFAAFATRFPRSALMLRLQEAMAALQD